jgi:hypothetical protein
MCPPAVYTSGNAYVGTICRAPLYAMVRCTLPRLYVACTSAGPDTWHVGRHGYVLVTMVPETHSHASLETHVAVSRMRVTAYGCHGLHVACSCVSHEMYGVSWKLTKLAMSAAWNSHLPRSRHRHA